MHSVLEKMRVFRSKQENNIDSLKAQRRELNSTHMNMVELFRVFYKSQHGVQAVSICATREQTLSMLSQKYAEYRLPDYAPTRTQWFAMLGTQVRSSIDKYFGNFAELNLNHSRIHAHLRADKSVINELQSRINSLLRNHKCNERKRTLKLLSPSSQTLRSRNHKTSLSVALLIDCENVNHNKAEDILGAASIFGDCKTQKIFGNFKNECVRPWKEKAQGLKFEI